MLYSCQPIGYYHSQKKEKYLTPRQANLDLGIERIRLIPKKNFEQALEGIEGFSRLWIIFWMHEAKNSKVKVLPPGCKKKQGVFSTRAPHRPNPIGLSSVKLIEIQGLDLIVQGGDLMDTTPILDIKPYIPQVDSFEKEEIGWIGKREARERKKIFIDLLAEKQIDWLAKGFPRIRHDLLSILHSYLGKTHPVRVIKKKPLVLAYKEWRLHLKEAEDCLTLLSIYSGYSKPPIPSLHQQFIQEFIL